MLEVREFKPEDAADVSRIMFDSFKTFLGHRMDDDKPVPPEQYANGGHARNEHYCSQAFTALDDGKVVGYINVSADLRSKVGCLGVIGVDPSSMAHGVGTALFKAAYAFWMEWGMKKIYTCTSSINTRAQRYYAKMGFVEEGRRKRHFFSDVDEISLVIYPEKEAAEELAIDVRPVVAQDAASVVAFLAKNGQTGWDEESIRSYAKYNGASLSSSIGLVAVSKADGGIVGALFASCINKYQLSTLSYIWVDAACRSRGVGTALVNALADEGAKRFGLRKIDCALPLEGVSSLPFLIHRGFVVEEALRDQNGPGSSVLRLGKFSANC